MLRRLLITFLFLFVILAVGIGGHLYLALRLGIEPAWPVPLRSALLALLALGFVAVFLRLFARGRLRAVSTRAFAWGAYVWLGFSFLLLVGTAATDGLVWLLGAASSSPFDAMFLARFRAVVVALFASVAAVCALRSALSPPAVKPVEISLARWPYALDGFRIVQISDLHIGPLLDRRFAADLARRIEALRPDLIAVTGDLVDGSVPRVRAEVEPLAQLHAPHGVYFVTGNHDYYSGARAWASVARELGWRVLRNERVAVETAGGAFDVAGVDDHHGGLVDPREGEDLPGALDGRDPSRPLLLLAHDPSTFRAASRAGVDLQLSGHTHGGQIWPFHWVVRAVVPWVAGLYRVGGSTLYVSRGTGFWGPPMRLAAPAEITEIVLRAGAPGASERLAEA